MGLNVTYVEWNYALAVDPEQVTDEDDDEQGRVDRDVLKGRRTKKKRGWREQRDVRALAKDSHSPGYIPVPSLSLTWTLSPSHVRSPCQQSPLCTPSPNVSLS